MATDTHWTTTSDLLVRSTDNAGTFTDSHGASNDAPAISLAYDGGTLIIEGSNSQLAHLAARIIGRAVHNHTGSVSAQGTVIDAIDKIVALVISED